MACNTAAFSAFQDRGDRFGNTYCVGKADTLTFLINQEQDSLTTGCHGWRLEVKVTATDSDGLRVTLLLAYSHASTDLPASWDRE
jgi:hypothetical protein